MVVQTVRTMLGFARRARWVTVAVRWLVAHRHAVGVVAGVTVAAALLATAALPPVLAPLVLGPLGAVIVTALIAPDDAGASARPEAGGAAGARRPA